MSTHTNSLETTKAQRDKASREDHPLQTPADLALRAEQPYFDTASARLAASRASGELHTLSLSCADAESLYELATVQRCVSAGADVNYESGRRLPCTLARFCMNGAVKAAVLCLESPNAVNFSTGNAPVLTTILETDKLTSQQRVELIRAAVHHMAEHPEDMVDWSHTVNCMGLDFISLAAENQLLSAVWPVIRDVPYLAGHVDPIRLTGKVWRWDFLKLGWRSVLRGCWCGGAWCRRGQTPEMGPVWDEPRRCAERCEMYL